VRRTYRPDRDPAGTADVLNRRYDALHAQAAARVDHDNVIVETGPIDSDAMELVDAVTQWRGRFELRREVHDDEHDLALSRIMGHADHDPDAAKRGIGFDHGTLVGVNLREGGIYDDEGRKALEAYVAALPADVHLPADRALAYEPVTIETTYTIGHAWRAHELAEPLIDADAELAVRTTPEGDVRVTLDDEHAHQLSARLADLPPSTWVAMILDGEYLGFIAPADGDPLRFHQDFDYRRKEIAAVLASGPLPSPMTYLTVEKLP
jgi:hypothetical protein